ncbi:hypothetical protein D1115_06475 [Vibrio alfacsensis]|uniref:Uncharacterized protein n=1 Tax=Vibrio alfacsensis TaxID=1074311 RepID=A0ABN5PFU0_9VIBR|nr:hypothetical protein [Vibrio alfacsensis]AXY00924.1 hypothetical protein D1115_06475 [Vibrio alfacsensis]
MRFYYILKTLEPVIVSKTTATTTNHQALDHISGSAVLGLVASDIYPQKAHDSDLTWSLFHSGEVQFGPCYPLIDGELSLPTPASWHFEKGEKVVNKGRYQGEKITNHANFERQAGCNISSAAMVLLRAKVKRVKLN